MSRFLDACYRRPTDATPVWFMRQAGRYQPEYRALRAKYDLLTMLRTPEIAVQVTLLPKALGVDALILFADILLPLVPLGLGLRFVPGKGPLLERSLRTVDDIARLQPFPIEEGLGFVLETVRGVRAAEPDLPLIGFAGAPFTLASYALEGGGSRHYQRTKTLMYAHPDAWDRLMRVLTEVTAAYLQAQVQAGAQAVQVFDSWVGALSPAMYRRAVLPHLQRLFSRLADLRVPRIYFSTGTAGWLPDLRSLDVEVISVDWRVDLDRAWAQLGGPERVAIQGNLDPLALLAPRDVLREQVHEVLRRAGGRPGHIFNLGHGILPDTDPDQVRRVVDWVHEATLAV
ncbi:MAG: uroporphyrinogen decarboxylase [Chloroflexi bacterium]|nr:uroporphyrinogen decarboxylase [Chloroflexota bacterium]